MIGADVAAIVRVQESPPPIHVGAGRAAAERYVRSHFHLPIIDSRAWKPRLTLNWVRAASGGSARLTAFFVHGNFVGTDADSTWVGQVGQVGGRADTRVEFALTLYRNQDPRCCPQGRTVTVRFNWNGKRLIQTRPLLREGVELSEGLQMPSRNIGCLFSQAPRYVRCDIRSGLKPAPPRPRGCDLDWAYGLEMTSASRPKTFCAGDTALAQGPVLAYGAALRIDGFTCLSHRRGLRCTNRAGHGLFLSRRRWRVF